MREEAAATGTHRFPPTAGGRTYPSTGPVCCAIAAISGCTRADSPTCSTSVSHSIRNARTAGRSGPNMLSSECLFRRPCTETFRRGLIGEDASGLTHPRMHSVHAHMVICRQPRSDNVAQRWAGWGPGGRDRRYPNWATSASVTSAVDALPPRSPRARLRLRESRLPHRRQHIGCGRRRAPQVVEHHRCGPHRSDRVGDALGRRCPEPNRAPARTSTGTPFVGSRLAPTARSRSRPRHRSRRGQTVCRRTGSSPPPR